MTPSTRPGPLAVLSWGLYLACAWTWCIGMYFPTLLLRDFGVWGWIIFAVPNVVGAAAVGFVFTSPERSRAFIDTHRAATTWFGIITIAFHGYWIAWLTAGLPIPNASGAILWAGLALAPFVVLSRWLSPRLLALGVGLISATALALALRNDWHSIPLAPATQPHADLLWLAPAVAFGFALCPPMDLTLQRARRSLPGRAGAAAFAMGFGIFFLAMIVYSAIYARPVLAGSSIATVPLVALVAHLLAQVLFTVGMHTRELRERGPGTVRTAAGALVVAAVLGAIAARTPDLPGPLFGGLSTGEIGYRAILSVYGLALPAYVWIIAIPRRMPLDARKAVRVWIAACAIATPCYWMGFVAAQHFYLVPGLLVLLLARLIPCRAEPAHAGR